MRATDFLPPGLRLGVSPLSWANDVLEDLGADIPLEACLRDAAEVGYDGVELGRKFPRQPELLAPLLREHGLSLASGWYSGELAGRGLAAEIAAVAPLARLLRAMGCQVLVYGEVAMMAPGAAFDLPMSHRRVMLPREVPGYAERLSAFARHLSGEYGLRLAYHHHLMMVAETFEEISDILGRCDPAVGLLLDTGHAVASGFSYTRLIERFGERIAHIHLKDVRSAAMRQVRDRDTSFNEGVRQGMFTVPGDGALDFGPLVHFAASGAYRGWLIVEAEQDPALAPPRAAVTRAFTHIRAGFAALPLQAGE
ncbi:myo-inosose-2 dehydratase [Salipiger mangrovisoli]|uniref:Myo-inosose-2 dehydratase n=1 Tax=Salipiger mangrovisoli TaxID=2865933 RepID=A0ABR9XCC1_9RHOB|nr:myo-inosose-2 dehydratase [Salipiger mangrovisoli]MBE9640961.1 myo-inosose-2 dehydratase [Salipiger mangrovisoli]